MAWPNARNELRVLLSDGPTDKYRDRKRLLGQVNGTNTIFKTFEFRRVTDFTASASPLGVFYNGTPVSVASDDPATGNVTLVTAPTDTGLNAVVEASYYIQYFLDAELDQFLTTASRWLISSTNPDDVALGLQPSAVNYAASEAYEKLAMRFSEHMSEVYRLEDSPDNKRMEIVETYKKASLDYRQKALSLRDEFYTRQGQALQPLFSSLQGRISDVPPRS